MSRKTVAQAVARNPSDDIRLLGGLGDVFAIYSAADMVPPHRIVFRVTRQVIVWENPEPFPAC